ncbi:hypothetical protein J7L18_00025, partial [Candidatus Bathyarchaeota archaeon]|nr:hypothetical protein [Candidatus Bathyarchaeota archaeon]
RQGELLLSLDFLEGYECELRRMNRGKVGRPYMLTERYVEFCMAKTMKNITKELAAKAYIYNMLINL